MLAAPHCDMNCTHSSSGDMDCTVLECKRRWLLDGTTCQPYQPSRVRSLIGDVLETWAGRWFTEQELVADIHRIRPRIQPGTVGRELRWLRQAGGVGVAGCWITVEFRPIDPETAVLSTSTTLFGWAMRVRPNLP
jgi:hypothetical protein